MVNGSKLQNILKIISLRIKNADIMNIKYLTNISNL